MIPFSPPRIDQKVIDEVVDTLKSGWITTVDGILWKQGDVGCELEYRGA